MGKLLRISKIFIGTETQKTLPDRVVSVAIRCLSNSANNLFVGFNADADSQNYLEPGDSMPIGPFRDGDYIGKNELRFAFENPDPQNGAVLIVVTEVDEIC